MFLKTWLPKSARAFQVIDEYVKGALDHVSWSRIFQQNFEHLGGFHGALRDDGRWKQILNERKSLPRYDHLDSNCKRDFQGCNKGTVTNP